MKKKVLCVLLALLLVVTCLSGAMAATSLYFVAVNDTVPLYRTDGTAPYYSSGKLYIPYTAFQANPNGVGASYNAEKGTFVLFNSNQMLLFDLEGETFTDNRGLSYTVDLAFRGGMLYVPASVAQHFGLSVTLLVSRAGYSIIRFTNGEQVYDDGTFVAQAENLITHVAGQIQTQTQHPSGSDIPVDPVEDPEPKGPVEIYMAFAGEAVSTTTVRTLSSYGIRTAFFFTESQILLQKDLVREIYGAGHTIGLTVEAGETDAAQALCRANEALDQVLFCKSVFALLPYGTEEIDGFHVLREPENLPAPEELLLQTEEPHLYLIRNGASGIIDTFYTAEATLLQLLETTY